MKSPWGKKNSLCYTRWICTQLLISSFIMKKQTAKLTNIHIGQSMNSLSQTEVNLRNHIKIIRSLFQRCLLGDPKHAGHRVGAQASSPMGGHVVRVGGPASMLDWAVCHWDRKHSQAPWGSLSCTGLTGVQGLHRTWQEKPTPPPLMCGL